MVNGCFLPFSRRRDHSLEALQTVDGIERMQSSNARRMGASVTVQTSAARCFATG